MGRIALNLRRHFLSWFCLLCKKKIIHFTVRIIARSVLRFYFIFTSLKEISKWVKTVICSICMLLCWSIPKWIYIHSLLFMFGLLFFWDILMLGITCCGHVEKWLLAQGSWYSLFNEFCLFGSDKRRINTFITLFVILQLFLKF